MIPQINKEMSPNFSSRCGKFVDKVILHYTADGPGTAVRYFLQRNQPQASAHYVVERDGLITWMVKLEYAAHHAGFIPRDGIERTRLAVIEPNRSSIGIEIVNWGMLTRGKTWTGKRIPDSEIEIINGRQWQSFTSEQYDAVNWLLDLLTSSSDNEIGIERRFMFNDEPYYMPCGQRASAKKFRSGICGHCHSSGSKPDPGPALDWKRLGL